MVLASIHMLVYTALFFIVGMYKPQWPLFFMKQPTRFLVSSITLVAIMGGVTLYGEGHKEELLLAKKAAEKTALVSEVPEAK
jgi:VIT1/CCC1 family predicted Fe2+/Mn2+ transporter